MPARSFGPFTSDGIPVPAGAKVQLRVKQTSGDPQQLAKLRFGVAQLEPKGSGGLLLPTGDPAEGLPPQPTYIYIGQNNGDLRKVHIENQVGVWTNDAASQSVHGVDVDADGFVYAGEQGNFLRKHDPDDGTVVWEVGTVDTVRDVKVGPDGWVFACGDDGAVRKYDPSDGSEITTDDWPFTGHTGEVWRIAIDSIGQVYSVGSDDTVRKITTAGQQVWLYTGFTHAVFGVDVDADGFVYATGRDETVHKIDPDGNNVWVNDTALSARGRCIAVDPHGFIYVGVTVGTSEVFKFDNDGVLVWSETEDRAAADDVKVDVDGFSYWSFSSPNEMMQLDADGNTVWTYPVGTPRGLAIS